MPHDFLADRRPAFVPIWRELFAGVDWLALTASPVYYGVGVPRGDGSAVIPIPGFLGTDLYLFEMRRWLGRIGYEAYASKVGQNAECLDVVVDRLLETVDRAAGETGRRVHLVGHSLGGIVARAAANLRPDEVASVVTLGSPFRGVRSHPVVLQIGDLVRQRIHNRSEDKAREECYTGYCNCQAVKSLRDGVPHEMRELAIYSKDDGVVSWRFCIHADRTKNVEVPGTHCGMAMNPYVYRHLARFLAG